MRVRCALALLALVFSACTASSEVSTTPASWQRIHCDAAVGSPAGAKDELRVSASGWKTDFSRHCVPLSEIASGGPPRDAITPLDEPGFIEMARADSWLRPQEPLIVVTGTTSARAYPLQILIWHEIVNDTIDGVPVAVTFCPLCNLSLVFERRAEGRLLTFGTTGNLRTSDLVMWDRQTESWWQQATGEAIVGELTGSKLARLPSTVLSFEEFRRAYPSGEVLSRDSANAEMERKRSAPRAYGTNPYAGYDRADSPPILGFWSDRAIDGRLPPKARVAVATFARPPVAYVLDALKSPTAINETIGGRRAVLLFAPGVASPLDRDVIASGVDVGQAAFYDPQVGGTTLRFRADGGGFTDEETGSTWTVAGLAVSGPLAGTRLVQMEHEVTYWFVWSVYRPETEVRSP